MQSAKVKIFAAVFKAPVVKRPSFMHYCAAGPGGHCPTSMHWRYTNKPTKKQTAKQKAIGSSVCLSVALFVYRQCILVGQWLPGPAAH